MSGTTATGFAFTSSPIVIGGQNIGGSFNFDLPVVAANSASDAYGFVNGQNAAAQNFQAGTQQITDAFAQPLLAAQTNYMDQIGQIFGGAAQTAASRVSSGSSGSGGGIFGDVLGGIAAVGAFL